VELAMSKEACPFCGPHGKVRKIVPKKREHIKYVPPNSRRCLYCKTSWWTPNPRTRPLLASPAPSTLVDGVKHYVYISHPPPQA